MAAGRTDPAAVSLLPAPRVYLTDLASGGSYRPAVTIISSSASIGVSWPTSTTPPGAEKRYAAIEHERADSEDRHCDEGADHSMNPEFPAVHNWSSFRVAVITLIRHAAKRLDRPHSLRRLSGKSTQGSVVTASEAGAVAGRLAHRLPNGTSTRLVRVRRLRPGFGRRARARGSSFSQGEAGGRAGLVLRIRLSASRRPSVTSTSAG